MARPASILAVAQFLWENADQLAALLKKLPPALRAAGEGIEAAGDGARMAGRALGGEEALPANAADALRQTTEAIRQVQQQLQAIANEVRAAADALEQLRVPTITPTKQRFNLKMVGLGEPELVTGITIGEQTPGALTAVAGRIRSQAGALEGGLAAQLGAGAERLEQMRATLDAAGDHLRKLGDSLSAGGGALREFGA